VEGREGEENGEGRGGEERKGGIVSSLFNFWLRPVIEVFTMEVRELKSSSRNGV